MRCVAEGGPGDPDTSHKFICRAMQLLVFVRIILETRLGAHGEPGCRQFRTVYIAKTRRCAALVAEGTTQKQIEPHVLKSFLAYIYA